MRNFPIGLIVLVIVTILIYFGIAHRILDRMRLSDKGALAVIGAIIIGSFFDIPFGQRVTINLGGIIAVGLAIYVWIKAGTVKEKIRSFLAAVFTALVLVLGARFLGAEPETMMLDPIYFYPLVAGIIGYLAGRSRRGAFFAAVMGVFALDVGQYFYLISNDLRGVVHVGGAGAFDSLILAGIFAVVIAEFVGETRERLQGGPATEGRPEELVKNLRTPEAEPARKPMHDYDDDSRDNDGGGDK